MLCTAKYRDRKHPSQSIRDYAMKMVKDHSLNPGTVYPFIQKVEDVIYGGKQPTEDAYKQTLVLFGTVFQDIVGKPLPGM